jgi:hypothetical protein
MNAPKADWVAHDPSPAAAGPSTPEQLLLPVVSGNGTLMSVTQVANFLNRSPDRVRQYAKQWTEDPTRGLPHMRFGPKGERFFPADDVEAFRVRMLEQAEARIEALLTWRIPVAAKRS